MSLSLWMKMEMRNLAKSMLEDQLVIVQNVASGQFTFLELTVLVQPSRDFDLHRCSATRLQGDICKECPNIVQSVGGGASCRRHW